MGILCVGQLVADILVAPVEAICMEQETQRVDQIVMRSGGDATNNAVTLAKLGNQVILAGKVGNDDFGRFLTRELRDWSVDTRGLVVTDKAATASVVVLIQSDGEHHFLYYGGANDAFCHEDIDLTLIDCCDIVHVGGALALPLFDGEGAAALFSEAHRKGKRTSMDVSWDISGCWLENIRPCLRHLDYFLPSQGEARRITGKESPPEIAGFLMREGVKTVVLKLGKKGCYVKNADTEFYLPAYDVAVLDTTGAGDSFVAGFLTGVQRGWGPEQCARFASAVSAHCIQGLGATTGIPGYRQVLQFMDEQASLPVRAAVIPSIEKNPPA